MGISLTNRFDQVTLQCEAEGELRPRASHAITHALATLLSTSFRVQ
jgi:hypothetical protein